MGDFGQRRYWAKNAGGHFKKDEKLKKKRQKVFKKGEKRGNVRKIEKKDAKNTQNNTVFSKSDNNPAPRQGSLRTSAAGALRE